MHKPNQPIQNRNAVFHLVMICVKQGFFYEARNLIRRCCEIGLTADQKVAVVEACKRNVSKRSAFGRGLAGLWFKWSLGRELRSR